MAMSFNGSQQRSRSHYSDSGRRLPVMVSSRGEWSAANDMQAQPMIRPDKRIDGWNHIQCAGEIMVN